MKKNHKKYILFLLMLSIIGYSQDRNLNKANKKYSNFAYIDAIKTYENIAKKGYKSVEMFQKLGNSYYFNSEFEKAASWYQALFEMAQDIEPEYYYRYSQSLKSIGQYAKSAEMLTQFNQKLNTDLRGKSFMDHQDYLDKIKENSGRYQIQNAKINSEYSDYGSAFFENKIVFTSARDTGNFSKRKHKWTNQYFTNLYASEISLDTVLANPEKFAKNINTRFHDATPVFTKDGKTMYFTRNNLTNGKKGKSDTDITLLKIYKSTLEDGEWKKEVALPFNSDNYSVAHPALSPDDTLLYFASDMPGTMGQSDLFKVKINEDGSFGIPENLGKTINTEGKETFPFISDENELYFASDGHPGLGGLDIYRAKIAVKGTFNIPLNIGEPANSNQDDFGYCINHKTRRGFLTSNRSGGKGSDDIYTFLEKKKLTCEQTLFGYLTDLDSSEILAQVKVSLLDHQFNLIKEVFTDSKGYYEFEIDCENTYYIKTEKEDYRTKEEKFTSSHQHSKIEFPIPLEKKVKQIANGDDLAKIFGIKIIYFDLDKSFIRPDAALELEKILDVMTANPGIKIDIRSHTDSRASFKYNEDLSKRRAKSTMEWLIKNKINSSRLSKNGYGERKLINHCADGVFCNENDHQANRRSEFIVSGL